MIAFTEPDGGCTRGGNSSRPRPTPHRAGRWGRLGGAGGLRGDVSKARFFKPAYGPVSRSSSRKVDRDRVRRRAPVSQGVFRPAVRDGGERHSAADLPRGLFGGAGSCGRACSTSAGTGGQVIRRARITGGERLGSDFGSACLPLINCGQACPRRPSFGRGAVLVLAGGVGARSRAYTGALRVIVDESCSTFTVMGVLTLSLVPGNVRRLFQPVRPDGPRRQLIPRGRTRTCLLAAGASHLRSHASFLLGPSPGRFGGVGLA